MSQPYVSPTIEWPARESRESAQELQSDHGGEGMVDQSGYLFHVHWPSDL